MPSMTITTTAQQAQRLATALGKALGYGRDATADEIKAYVVDHFRQLVHREERQEVAPTAFDPT